MSGILHYTTTQQIGLATQGAEEEEDRVFEAAGIVPKESRSEGKRKEESSWIIKVIKISNKTNLQERGEP